MAVVIRYWRDCLVLVREGGCEGKRVVVFAKKCGYTIAGCSCDVWILTAESRPQRDGKLRSPSLGLHNLQANDKTGYCVIKQFSIFDRLPMVFRGCMNLNEELSTVYGPNKIALRFSLLGRFRLLMFCVHRVRGLMLTRHTVLRYACHLAPFYINVP